jgi:hypothetical protein
MPHRNLPHHDHRLGPAVHVTLPIPVGAHIGIGWHQVQQPETIINVHSGAASIGSEGTVQPGFFPVMVDRSRSAE